MLQTKVLLYKVLSNRGPRAIFLLHTYLLSIPSVADSTSLPVSVLSLFLVDRLSPASTPQGETTLSGLPCNQVVCGHTSVSTFWLTGPRQRCHVWLLESVLKRREMCPSSFLPAGLQCDRRCSGSKTGQ